MKDTKMIRVTSRGYVTTSRGRVISPIMSPYRESISRIWSMITTDRADVEEKLPDGSFVKLTAQNFDKDNFVSEEVKQVEKPELKDPVETFKNTDGENKAPEEDSNKQEQVETPVQNNAESENNSDEVDKEPAKDKNTEAPVEGENKAPEEDSNKQEQVETPVQNNNQNNDPRYNKKNKNKNRNNNQNANKQSVEVTAEPVQ